MEITLKEQDFSKMSRAELLKMMASLQEEADRKRDERKAQIRDEIQLMLSDDGFTLDEIFPNRGGKADAMPASKSKIEPKYQDPREPMNTWTGRGRKPKWFIEATEGGMTLEEMEIQK